MLPQWWRRPPEPLTSPPSAVLPGGTIKAVTNGGKGRSVVTAPATADGRVRTATSDGSSVSFGLPNVGNSKGTKAGDGTIVYPDAAKFADLAVQPVTHGVRTLITIKNAGAAKQYRFDLGLPNGATIQQLDGGSVLVTKGNEPLGIFDAPWAKDANGNAVPTSYHVEGGALVQTVEFQADTAFPVVADPWYNPFSWNWKKIGRAALSRVKSCGAGALTGALGLGGGTVTVNVIKKAAGKALIRVAGGPWTYVSTGVAGCIARQF